MNGHATPDRGAKLFRVLTRRPVSRLPLRFRMWVYRWWAIPSLMWKTRKVRR